MIRPSKSDYLRTARPGHVVAVAREISADRMTPIDAFYALSASYILESAEKGSVIGRYSFIGVEPVVRICIENEKCTISENGASREMHSRDPLRIIDDILRERTFVGEGDLSPFPGGAVGYVGYDMVRRYEHLPLDPARSGLDMPDALFMITRFTLVFDNLMHTVRVICNIRTTDNPDADYEDAVAGIDRITLALSGTVAGAHRASDSVTVGELKPSVSRKDFEKSVANVKELIASGECIQVVLSQRLSAPIEGDPFAIFRALRSINPSPYMFYLDFEEFQIFGASPEVMVRVENGRAMLRPIAGTRPRGATPEQDEALRVELLADEKERAEHIMLIDLARNDLGRIAQAGTVSVDRMMEVERYSHVMHIVSEVSAKLKAQTDVFDVIRATFPAGTVSGAPKVRAMQIIDQFENVKRNAYAGLVGYFSYRGGFDSCITIRSAVVKNGQIHLQAGAGLVYDSVPETEYQETINKANALTAAIRIAGGAK